MSVKKLTVALSTSLVTFLFLNYTTKAKADGFIIPHENKIIRPIIEIPNFSIKHHKVTVDIRDNYAKTNIDQIFQNNSNSNLEGTYFFPIPEDASLSNFSMFIGNENIAGKIYTKEEARKIYEDIVRKRQDPAILEFLNRGFFKASIFPIPAKGDAKTKIQYEELLKENNHTFKYNYSLNTEKFSNKPLENTSINIKLKTTKQLKSIYSPSHDIKITKINDNEAIISYEEKETKPDTEFTLYYTVSDQEFDINLLSFKEKNEEFGYFLLLGAPKYQIKDKEILPKNIVFVMDTSGSMNGKKITQAKDALRFCIDNLNKKDDFNILSFSDYVRQFNSELVNVDEVTTQNAIKFTDKMEASGGTNIDEAMKVSLDMLKNEKKQSIIMFLTDGQPTVGITNNEEILGNIKSNNLNKSKIFVFGVGYDVNIHFLDKISQENHGFSEYVRPNENIESSVSSIFSKINTPVLSNIKINYQNNAFEILPKELPDIFKGSQLMIIGKYKNEGKYNLKLVGDVLGKQKEFNYKLDFKSKSENSFIPRIWATRKIGYLLDELRLSKNNNKELLDEIIRLSKKYGIVTEFTSFLVADDVVLSEAPSLQSKRTEEKMDAAKSFKKGSWAVSQSQNSSNLKSQMSNAPSFYLNEEGKKVAFNSKVKYVGQKSFFLKNNIWVDPEYTETDSIEVQIYSNAYFEIINKIKNTEKYFMLGKNISVNINGINIKIGNTGITNLGKKEKALLKI